MNVAVRILTPTAKPKLTVTVLLYSRIPSGDKHFLAQATPEDKMALIRHEQEGGKLVAVTGDGTNDAPALAQADIGMAMNTGTQAAKEAGNMVARTFGETNN